jgi:Uma2 family endonuclease
MADDFRTIERPPIRPPRGAGPVRFQWADVLAMSDAGLFAETERVELIDGELSIMPEEGPLHVMVLQTLQRWFYRNLSTDFEPFIRGALKVGNDSYLISDISILKASFLPSDCNVANADLIVEVSVSTLTFDLNVKRKRYASAGAKELWIVDANAQRIMVHRQPSGEDFLFVQTFAAGEPVSPLCCGEHSFDPANMPSPSDFN